MWLDTATGCPEKLWLPPPWKCSRLAWMGLWATWSSRRCPCPWQGGVGLDDLQRCLPNQTILWFYDSIPSICSTNWCRYDIESNLYVHTSLKQVRIFLCGTGVSAELCSWNSPVVRWIPTMASKATSLEPFMIQRPVRLLTWRHFWASTEKHLTKICFMLSW